MHETFLFIRKKEKKMKDDEPSNRFFQHSHMMWWSWSRILPLVSHVHNINLQGFIQQNFYTKQTKYTFQTWMFYTFRPSLPKLEASRQQTRFRTTSLKIKEEDALFPAMIMTGNINMISLGRAFIYKAWTKSYLQPLNFLGSRMI